MYPERGTLPSTRPPSDWWLSQSVVRGDVGERLQLLFRRVLPESPERGLSE